ncbi:MAG TPA: hypothetical protein PKW33_16125, partial [Anaerolineaceae bacterium]|nr:hypothetical protein [Anaerolineaceae bacterium]
MNAAPNVSRFLEKQLTAPGKRGGRRGGGCANQKTGTVCSGFLIAEGSKAAGTRGLQLELGDELLKGEGHFGEGLSRSSELFDL